MTIKDNLKEAGYDYPELRVTGYEPVIGKSPSQSKFGGKAFADEDHPPPKYPLMLQLHVDTLPDEAKKVLNLDTGYIQLFYDRDLGSYEHDGEGQLCRYFVPRSEHVSHDVVISEGYKEKFIIDWKPFADYRAWEDAEFWDILYPDELETIVESEEDLAYPQVMDKLLGAPAFVQGPEYSKCKICGTQKRHIFNIESECNVDFMFGDSGSGQLQQCPNCVTEFSFGWACH
ncbi:hypothetical protein P9112_008654 [Eukaryota sp. TZLM1-RC]